ncbi:hypothetical protein QTG54_013951 [Skeletonema marinoi]|uniref:Uncharacterized protein n=1 Tax=Skeletonema marinoi TaxID=267567 RepID=A0AAD8XXL2_9STRA|nr:hypothetical protein QTG54_013951 [Skeletonema marinoi]
MAKSLALSILMPFFINASLTSTNHVRVAILAILIIIGWRIILRMARAYVRLLETDAMKFLRNDDGLMLDCTDDELLEAITQSALRRGIKMSTGTSFYHANSSSGDSFESNNSSFNEHNATLLRKPQQMMQQVGGVSSHKKPVLTMEPHYILKPLRLTHLHQETSHHDYNGARDGLKDKTKVYRGVREIAFYEALAFASRVSHLIASCMEPDNNSLSTEGKSIGYILSCHCNIFRPYVSSFPDAYISNGGTRSIVKRVKDLSTSADVWNRLAFLVAHYAGDEAVMSAFKSYIDTCTTLATTMISLNKISDFTPDYYGVVDLQTLTRMNTYRRPPHRWHTLILLGNIPATFDIPTSLISKWALKRTSLLHQNQSRGVKYKSIQSRKSLDYVLWV